MSALRDRLRDILDTLDGIGVDPQHISCHGDHVNLMWATCTDYEKACRAFKTRPEKGRLLPRPDRRIRETLQGTLLMSHTCWPHLDCWGET